MTADPAMTLDGFHAEFAVLAEHIAGQRVGAYAQSFTRHRIFAMQAIAEIWRCAADNLMPRRPLMAITRIEALEELALTIEAATKRARNRPDDPERQLQLEQLTAMRWWHAQFAPPGRGPKISYAYSMTFTLRTEALQRMLSHQAEAERNAA
jgi:hypothetical protein